MVVECSVLVEILKNVHLGTPDQGSDALQWGGYQLGSQTGH